MTRCAGAASARTRGMKNPAAFARLVVAWGGEIDEPLGQASPENWLIRRVHG